MPDAALNSAKSKAATKHRGSGRLALPITNTDCAMSTQDLTQEELTAVAEALRRMIDADRFPLAPRLRPLKSALAKLDPPAAVSSIEPLPPPKPWTNSTIGQRKRR